MMPVYVVQYAQIWALEAEIDDPSTSEGGLEGMASPQFAAVLSSLEGVEAIRLDCEREYREGIEDEFGRLPEHGYRPRWEGPRYTAAPAGGRESWMWTFFDDDAYDEQGDIPVAVLVVQKVGVA